PHQAPKRVSDCCREMPARRARKKLACGGRHSRSRRTARQRLQGHARLGLRAIFRGKLRVAIFYSFVGVTPTGNGDAGKFAADTTQLPTGCQPESLAKPAR